MESEKNIEKEQPKKKWREILVEYFIEIIKYEEYLESLRQSLLQQNNISISNIFNYLDNDSKGYITLGDLIKFLSSHSIEFEEKYLRQLIHFYDKNSDFVLNFDEFKFIILPLDEEIKENNENENQELDENIISILCDIFIQEIELCKKCEEKAKNCMDSRHFTIYEGFVEIADEEGYITEEMLLKFFGDNGVNIDEKNIKRIIYRLDGDNDGKISFLEFKNLFFPSCGSLDKKYSEYKYKLNDFDINNKKINKSKDLYKNKKPNNISIDNNSNNNNYNKNLDLKYDFSKNPRMNYTSSVLNYNYSKSPDMLIKDYCENDLTFKSCPLNPHIIFCQYCGCGCHLCNCD